METPTEESRILYRHILGDGKTPRTPTAKEIADRTGKAAVTVYKYLEGEVPLSLTAFRAIYLICRDRGCPPVEALRHFVTSCDPDLYLGEVNARGEVNGDLRDDACDSTAALGDAVREIQDALRDGQIDEDENEKIRTAVSQTIERLHGIIEELNAMTPKRGMIYEIPPMAKRRHG